MNSRGSMLVARLQVLAASALFSTGGAAIKGCALTAWQVACFRAGVAGLVLAAFLPAARRAWSWRAVAVGFAFAVTMVLFVAANKLTTAAHAIFLQDTAPIYVLLASPLLLGERIGRREVVTLVVMAAGLVLFFVGLDSSSATAPDPLRGNLLGLASSLTWAATIMGLRWLRERPTADRLPPIAESNSATTEAEAVSANRPGGGAPAAVLFGNALACAVCLPMALPVETIRVTDGLLLGYLGGIQVALAYIILLAGLRRVRALEASLLLLLEPILAPVWAYAFHGENPGPWALVGGTLVVAAMGWQTLGGRRRS